MMPEDNQIVEVNWVDACSEDAYIDLSCTCQLEPITRRNVGYLVKSAETYIVIASGKIDNLYKRETGHSGGLCIPRGMITSIKNCFKNDPQEGNKKQG